MLSTVAQIGLPGTQELIIVVFIFLLLAAPVLAIALLIKFLTGSGADEERVAELEREVAELRDERETATGKTDDKLE